MRNRNCYISSSMLASKSLLVFWLHLCFVFVFSAVFWLCLVFYVCVLVTSCVLCLSFFRHHQNHSIMRCFPVQFLVDQQLQWCCTISLSRQTELIQEWNQSWSLISKLIWIKLIIELIQESNQVKVAFPSTMESSKPLLQSIWVRLILVYIFHLPFRDIGNKYFIDMLNWVYNNIIIFACSGF